MVDGQQNAALGYVKPGGQFASIAGNPGNEKCTAASVTCTMVAGGNGAISYGTGLRAPATLADQGKYTVQVTRTFPLAQAAQAQKLAHEGEMMGKYVLDRRPGERRNAEPAYRMTSGTRWLTPHSS